MLASGVQVSGVLIEMLSRYLDSRQAVAPDLSAELDTLRRQQRIPIETWWRLLREIDRCVEDPATGLAIGLLAQPRDFGAFGYLAASCSTLGQVLERFQRYQPLIHNLSSSRLVQRGAGSMLSWDPTQGRSTHLSDEVLTAGLLSVARILSGKPDLGYDSVAFIARAPADISVYETRLGCPVRFESPTLDLVFPASALALPIDSSDPYLMGLMEQQAQALLQAVPQPDALLSQLQQLLVDTLQEGEPTCARIAGLLGIPERTLYRRLRERGLSYKGMLTDMRRQLALRYLADDHLSLSDIAQLLGYSEQSAFTRAFRQWFGATPLRHRQTRG